MYTYRSRSALCSQLRDILATRPSGIVRPHMSLPSVELTIPEPTSTKSNIVPVKIPVRGSDRDAQYASMPPSPKLSVKVTEQESGPVTVGP